MRPLLVSCFKVYEVTLFWESGCCHQNKYPLCNDLTVGITGLRLQTCLQCHGFLIRAINSFSPHWAVTFSDPPTARFSCRRHFALVEIIMRGHFLNSTVYKTITPSTQKPLQTQKNADLSSPSFSQPDCLACVQSMPVWHPLCQQAWEKLINSLALPLLSLLTLFSTTFSLCTHFPDEKTGGF